jgi:NAD+ kinase
MDKCLIIANTYKRESQQLADDIRKFLLERDIESVILPYSGNSLVKDIEKYSLAISLGGDGTVLFAARLCAPHKIPVFAINLGEFGFIAGIQPHEWKNRLNNFLNNTEHIDYRNLVSATVFRNNKKIFTSSALNDVVISAKGSARLVSLNIQASGIPFGKFKADGIIIATPTGSTAYSAAAGGPIVDPSLDALILNPVSPFSLSNRPLVLPSTMSIEITLLPSRSEEVILSCDGQVLVDLAEGDVVKIGKSEDSVMLVGCNSHLFYSALRSKLNWSGGPHA